jgi:hypothetical protein
MTEIDKRKSWLKHLITEEVYVIAEVEPLNDQNAEHKDLAGTINSVEHHVDEPAQDTTRLSEILVVHIEAADPVVNENNNDLMWKVLGSVDIDENDVDILVAVPEEHLRMEEQLSADNYHKIIIFGPDIKLPGEYTSALYEVKKNPSKIVLRADQLEVIAPDQGKKRALWSALKLMFEID